MSCILESQQVTSGLFKFAHCQFRCSCGTYRHNNRYRETRDFLLSYCPSTLHPRPHSHTVWVRSTTTRVVENSIDTSPLFYPLPFHAREAVYLDAQIDRAEALERFCLSSSALDSEGAAFYQRQRDVNVLFVSVTVLWALPLITVGRFPDFVPNALVEMHCLVGVGMIALAGQRDIVSHFQPYTNGAEQSMDYGQVLAIVGLVPSLVPLYQYCKDYCPDNEHEHGLGCILSTALTLSFLLIK